VATYCTLTGVDVENTKHARNRKLIAAVQSLPVLELDTTTALCPLVVVVTNSSNPITYMLPNDSVRSNARRAATTTDRAKTTPGLLRQTPILATGT